ncbi:hypothetical protein HPB49_005032 [Dermacentor silvarum]|uniref:Uncharacterized protein n=1 Tax=Dermacentor silvarum TaxID=543639 RepID=A0ACB8D332_DERSI|nr:hypothetical protein HPB49_005032 [Dermacentor silvarum]
MSSLLEAVDAMPVCSGASLLCEFPFASSGKNLKVWNGKLYQHKCKGTSSKDERRCMSCKYLRKLLVNQRYRKKQAAGKLTRATKLKAKAQTVRRLRNKVKTLDQTIAQLKLENEEIEEGALLSKIDKLPSKQKNAIMQCFEAARRKSLNGMRYNPEWMLECVIMHMKSPRLYEHWSMINSFVERAKFLLCAHHGRTCVGASRTTQGPLRHVAILPPGYDWRKHRGSMWRQREARVILKRSSPTQLGASTTTAWRNAAETRCDRGLDPAELSACISAQECAPRGWRWRRAISDPRLTPGAGSTRPAITPCAGIAPTEDAGGTDGRDRFFSSELSLEHEPGGLPAVGQKWGGGPPSAMPRLVWG